MKRKKWIRPVLIILLLGVMVFCIVRILSVKREYDTGEAIYGAALDEFVANPEGTMPLPDAEEPPETSEDAEADTDADDVPVQEEPKEEYPDLGIDFDKLRQVNEDIVGWIWIPDTRINYPLVQGKDNSTYLRTAYNLQPSRYGSAFLDYRNHPDFTDTNTIIYGHNMRNDAMFGTLSNFADLEFAENHTDLYIYTPDATYHYKIFSAYTAKTYEFPYIINFEYEKSHEEFLQFIVEESVSLRREEPLTMDDRIVTLSTCLSTSSYYKRFVVHGVLVSSSLD